MTFWYLILFPPFSMMFFAFIGTACFIVGGYAFAWWYERKARCIHRQVEQDAKSERSAGIMRQGSRSVSHPL